MRIFWISPPSTNTPQHPTPNTKTLNLPQDCHFLASNLTHKKSVTKSMRFICILPSQTTHPQHPTLNTKTSKLPNVSPFLATILTPKISENTKSLNLPKVSQFSASILTPKNAAKSIAHLDERGWSGRAGSRRIPRWYELIRLEFQKLTKWYFYTKKRYWIPRVGNKHFWTCWEQGCDQCRNF